MRQVPFFILLIFSSLFSAGQVDWQNIDSLYGPLPASVHVYKTTSRLDGKPNIAYYLEADLRDRGLYFSVDTSKNRRLTPAQFYKKGYDSLALYENFRFPLVVVNATFFSFASNQNLNAVIMEGKLVGYNIHTINGRGKDTFTYRHPFGSALGISKKREADIAWLFTDSSSRYPLASQFPVMPVRDSIEKPSWPYLARQVSVPEHNGFEKWKMRTAVGGGPVLVQKGEIRITNNEELKFAGKAIADKHPRTAMGYSGDHKLIILVIEGRYPGIAEGATLTQEALLLKKLGCLEALNLDGGGSSCLLVNGKETIRVSDISGQRPVPAVFIIRSNRP
ncbi:MAG: phosphodiester glycosidase family protein [Sphingobacteriales bacterium]|nr:phosphodiester glycosidase family protein [Sphingobacteriales bacterium]